MASSSSHRVLYVLNSLLTGGAEALVASWSRGLAERHHHVEVCTLYTRGPLVAPLENAGIRVHDLALLPDLATRRTWRKYDLRGVLALARLIRQGRYDIVHAHLFPASLFVALASILARGPAYLFSEHNAFNRRRRHRGFKLLDRAIYGRYSRVLAVSDAVAATLREWLPGAGPRVDVLANTVDEARFRARPALVRRARSELNLSGRELVVLFAGRLEPAKNPGLLLEAARLLGDRARHVRVLVAGDGPLRAQLEAEAAGVHGPTITFLGFRADTPALYAIADLVVLPSAWEGLPMVLLEAMATRTPVIATAVGGVPDVIEHGVTGWLVPPGDPAQLAGAIEHVLASPELRARLAANAVAAYASRFSFDAAIARLLTIYHDVLNEDRRGALPLAAINTAARRAH